MKKYAYFALMLVLTTALLVGCGCTNRNMDNPSEPTVLPTNEEVWDTSAATTHATTEATMPTGNDATGSTNGNGGTGSNGGVNGNTGTHATTEATNGTDTFDNTTTTEGGMESRARRMIPGSNG